MSRTKDPSTCACSCGGIDTEWHRYWECTKHVASRNGVRSLFPSLAPITQLTGIVPIGSSLSLGDIAKVQKHMVDVVIATSDAHLVLDNDAMPNHNLDDQASTRDNNMIDDDHAAAADYDVMRSHQSGRGDISDRSRAAGLSYLHPLPPLPQEVLDTLQADPPPYPHIVRGVRRLHGDNQYIRRLLKCKICGFVASEAHQQGFYAKHADCCSVASHRDRVILTDTEKRKLNDILSMAEPLDASAKRRRVQAESRRPVLSSRIAGASGSDPPCPL